MINYLGWLNSFIVAVPNKKGTKYYVSCLNLHYNPMEGHLILVEMKQWRETVGRYGAKLIVDQTAKMLYMIGGYDLCNGAIPYYLAVFSNLRWEYEKEYS